MATINLGSIKFNWKGSYSGATAYVVDDVVESGGNSYICIAATTGNTPPNATYWELMSQAGTNGTDGTDLGTTLTTQGDIVYRDASGLARLGAGTAGQVLQTNGTGANPSWGTVSSEMVLLHETDFTGGVTSLSIDGFVNSTYYSYKIHIQKLRGSVTGSRPEFRFNKNGSAISTGIHFGAIGGHANVGGTMSTVSDGNWGDGQLKIGSDMSTDSAKSQIYEFFTNDWSNTNEHKMFSGRTAQWTNNNGIRTIHFAGSTNDNDAVSGFTLVPQFGNIVRCKAKVYGLKE